MGIPFFFSFLNTNTLILWVIQKLCIEFYTLLLLFTMQYFHFNKLAVTVHLFRIATALVNLCWCCFRCCRCVVCTNECVHVTFTCIWSTTSKANFNTKHAIFSNISSLIFFFQIDLVPWKLNWNKFQLIFRSIEHAGKHLCISWASNVLDSISMNSKVDVLCVNVGAKFLTNLQLWYILYFYYYR